MHNAKGHGLSLSTTVNPQGESHTHSQAVADVVESHPFVL